MDENVKAVVYGIDENFAEVGRNLGSKLIVSEIIYHTPKGEGDRHYCDVICEGYKERIFNICSVIY